MVFLPVAEREAREACRQARTYHWRWIVAALSLLVMTLTYFAARQSRSLGEAMFTAVTVTTFIYCLFGGALRTADTIAEEKRENTLGLLFLTDLKTFDILLGKLIASSVNCIFGLVAVVPLLALPMIMGGVDLGQFGRVTLALFNTLFLSMAWGFVISAIFRKGATTVAAATLAAVFWGGIVTFLAVFLHEELRWTDFAGFLMVFSPVSPVIAAFEPRPDPLLHYWTATAVNHVLGWAWLGLALFLMPRLWQDAPKNRRTERIREFFRSLRFGKARQKKQLRWRLLGENPIYWLANREQISSGGLLLVMTIVLGLALALGLAMIHRNPGNVEEMTALICGSLAVAHAFTAFRIAGAASYRLAEDRRNGALELILATSISIREVLRGQWKALARQFFGPAAILSLGLFFIITLFLLIWMQNRTDVGGSVWTAFVRVMRNPLDFSGPNGGFGMALLIVLSIGAMLSLNWVALGWVGMWLGLRFKRPAVALWTSLALVFVPPAAIFVLTAVVLVESDAFQTLRPEEFVPAFFVYGWILGAANLLFLTRWARSNLYSRFRESASDRFTEGHAQFPWRTLGRFALRTAGVVVALFIAFAAYRVHSNRRGDAAWAAARARFPEFALTTPEPKSIPADQNLAKAPIVIALSDGNQNQRMSWNFTAVNPWSRHDNVPWNWTIGLKTDFYKIEKIYADNAVITRTSAAPVTSVLKALRRFDKPVAELKEEARARPLTQFPRDKSEFTSQWYSYDRAVNLRPLVGILAIRSCAKLAAAESDALEEIFLGLRLADSVRDDPRRMLVRAEMILDMMQPAYEAITSRTLNDEELARFQKFFGELDLFRSFDTYRADWVRQQIALADKIIEGRTNQHAVGFSEGWLARKLPYGQIRAEQSRILKAGMTEMAAPLDITNRTIDLYAAQRIFTNAPRGYINRYGAYYPFAQTLRATVFLQSTADRAALACALERHRLKFGKYPQRLEELAPAFLAEIPRDIFTGKPIIYELDGDDFRLRSVAWDGKDDAGRIGAVIGSWTFWQETQNSDWVWNSKALDPPPPKRNR